MKKHANRFLVAAVFVFPCLSWAAPQPDDLVMLGDSVNNAFVQHPIKETDRSWDLAISGGGFFPLRDSKTGEILYTRLGKFELDREGYVFLSGQPNLRLMMHVDSRVEPLNLSEWSHLGAAEMAGLSFDDEKDWGALKVIFSDGEVKEVARVVLVKFFNNEKLVAVAPHIYEAGEAVLPSLMARPGEKGLGRVTSKSLEQL